MGVIVRLLSPAAMSIRKAADRLGQEVLRRGGGVSTRILEGYIVRAAGDRRTVTVTVVEPPGVVVIPDPLNPADGTAYSVGTRDVFDSRTSLVDGPYTRADIPIKSYETTRYALGFSLDYAPWLASLVRPGRYSATVYKDRLRAGSIRVYPVVPGFPYSVTDQVPVGTDVFTGVEVYPRSASSPSYYIGDDLISSIAPGYTALPRTTLGYMTWQYQGMPATTVSSGSLTLVVVPVVKLTDESSAVHWGSSGVLFLLVDVQKAEADGLPGPVLWSRLWTPDEHSYDFLHNGPWQMRPDGSVSSFYTAPDSSWDGFWNDWGTAGNPQPAGGSRPNWTDAISAAWFNGEFVVNMRVCALNGSQETPASTSYICVPGYGNMRFKIGPTGVFSAAEKTKDVWSVQRSLAFFDAPYDRWVAGQLDASTITAVHPLATLSDATRLVEIRLSASGSRTTDYASIGGGLTGLIHPRVTLPSSRLEVDVTRLDSGGAPLPVVTHTVSFSTLGKGLSIPATPTPSADGTMMLMSPFASYKLCPADQMFSLLSDNELAFVVRDYWQAVSPSTPTPVYLAVLDLTTGACAIRGSLGFSHHERLGYATAVHLDCIQQTVRGEGGVVTLEGVLLASCSTEAAVRISRDSGVTWSSYIEFPTPQSGAYYIGNPLMGGGILGSAIE